MKGARHMLGVPNNDPSKQTAFSLLGIGVTDGLNYGTGFQYRLDYALALTGVLVYLRGIQNFKPIKALGGV